MLDIRLRDFGRRRVDSWPLPCIVRWCMGKREAPKDACVPEVPERRGSCLAISVSRGCFARALPVRCSTLSYEGHEARNWKHWVTLQSNL